MDIHIVAGGPSSLLPELQEYNFEDCIWVGVDRGIFTLLQKGIHANIAFGDFDSVTEEEFMFIEENVPILQKYKPEKDETDLELAILWALEQQPACIRLFGASGGRIDHFLANVSLLIKPLEKNNTKIEMIDNKNLLYLAFPGTYNVNKDQNKKYISFLPYTAEVKGLTLSGFKYPLKDCDLPIGSTLCISNELISEYGTFSFSKGILMIVRSQD